MAKVQSEEFYLVGFEGRTDNAREFSGKGIIEKTWKRVFQENLHGQVTNAISQDIYAVYSNYESDENGKYDYFIGYKVKDLTQIPKGLAVRKILSGPYEKYKTSQGFPHVVVPETWAKIWTELKGKRAFKTDFEIYGECTQDPNNAVVDVYVGVL